MAVMIDMIYHRYIYTAKLITQIKWRMQIFDRQSDVLDMM